MADAVASQVLHDGPTSVTVKITNISDGTGESAVTKVDVSALTPAPAEVALMKLLYSTDGLAVRLLWDADTDTLAWAIPANQSDCIDFGEFGGVINDAGTGKTGDVKLTTVGHSSGDSYSIIAEFRKRFL